MEGYIKSKNLEIYVRDQIFIQTDGGMEPI